VRSRAPTLRRRAADDPESLGLIGLLIDRGANPNARTPKRPKITDAMVGSAQRPAIDNVVNLGGATPFLLAAQIADLSAMRLMLARGADPRLATYENTTTLAVAAGVGFVEGRERARPESDALTAAKLLIEAGVDVNAVSERGQTALHGAVYRAANDIIRLLVASGARTDIADELGRTPLQLAETGFNQVASVIRRETSAALLRSLSGSPSSVGR
jgi:ankyrin repeat protein